MKPKIKVLQIDMGDYFRGAEKQELEIFRNINNVTFDFLNTNIEIYKKYEDEIHSLGGNIYSLDVKRNNFINKIKYSHRIYKFLKNNNYDYIHINSSAFFYSLNVASIAKRCKVKKIVLHSHSIPKNSKLKRLLINVLNSILTKKVDVFLSCSKDASYSLFSKKFVDKNKVIILKNGIDIDKYKFNEKIRDEYRKKLNIENKIVYVHTGSFSKEKNHEYLINLFYEIQKVQNNSILLLVGSGDLLDTIKEKVNKLNISDKVIFLGFRDDINNILNASDIFIFPSLHEGLGISIIESQTNGLVTYVSSAIPKEANISPYFKSFNLNDDITYEIINTKLDLNKRKNAYKYTTSNGYDIKDVSNKLEDIYRKGLDNNE